MPTGTHFNEMIKLLRSGKEVYDVGDSTNKTPEKVGDDYSEGNQMPHGQNKDEVPTDQIGQKFKAVNIVEGSDPQAFEKILQDVVPQMVNSMSSSIKKAIDTSLCNFGKMLQYTLQIFSKKMSSHLNNTLCPSQT